jgi:predicted Zn-dependent protease
MRRVFALLCLMTALPARAQTSGDVMINKLIDRAGKANQSAPSLTDPAQEAALGREWAAVLTGAAKLWSNERAQKYVNNVGRWLSVNTERPELAWKFGILDSDDINAFATPGGYVFITRGLFLRLSNEAELAGVLAHEVAHVVQQHHLKAMQSAAGSDFLGETLNDVAQERAKRPDLAAKLVGGIKDVMLRGLDRGDELEADRMGIVIAARAGYDPYGLPAALQMIGSLNPQQPELGLLFATHPDPTSRLDALERAMSGAAGSAERTTLASERFAQEAGFKK